MSISATQPNPDSSLKRTSRFEFWCWTAVCCGIIALFVSIGTSPARFFSDEAWYLNQTGFVHKYGLSADLVKHWHGSSGPLVGLTHSLAEPLTHLSAVGSRLVNALLFVGLMLAQAFTLRATNPQKLTSALLASSWWLAIPLVWRLAGVVYTEMPSMAFTALGLLLLAYAIGSGSTASSRILVGLAAGLCFSLALFGRQPLAGLIVSAGIAGVAAWRAHGKRTAFPWLLCVLGTTPCAILLFSIWGGLQPPILQNVLTVSPSRGLAYALLSGGYSLVAVAFLRPALLKSGARFAMITLATALPLCLFSADFGGTIPLQSALEKLPQSLSRAASFGATLLLGFAGTYFYALMIREAWRRRKEPFALFLVVSAAGLTFSHFLIGPVFSTRYPCLALPFLFLWAKPQFTGISSLPRYLLGVTLGAWSLIAHLNPNLGPGFWDSRMEVFYPHLWKDRAIEVFSPQQWEKFDYGNSHWIQNPRWGEPVRQPVTP